MRGEQTFRISEDARVLGSSPHARGAGHSHVALLRLTRIIPACAGSRLLG